MLHLALFGDSFQKEKNAFDSRVYYQELCKIWKIFRIIVNSLHSSVKKIDSFVVITFSE